MQVVERREVTIVGIEVVAPFSELAVVVPQVWARVFARRGDLPSGPDDGLVDFSTDLGGGDYREVLGAVVDVPPLSLPEGWTLGRAPAGRYLHHRHVGDVSAIADTFAEMYRWAATNELRAGAHKLDVGYHHDQHGPHDLYLQLQGPPVRPDAPRRGR
ncbi:GyrI-like domain-containing protein [Rhodococcus sp. SGAir0479]|uniref:GyrI-like domain-containing protein n=1 Tax=Rhodococcus sp. SGAir0479 TaxID=2567884 RepID=UPI0010CD43BE|nr:GyrI-like domain-containing protein [Rhodococcus sp. SGAir0479]QCQ91917.1 AraC family transcriptional regulator [Rhodococcus sp. SGAir0479]